MKKIRFITDVLKLFCYVFVLISLFGLFIDIIKYIGFFEKYLLIKPVLLFAISFLSLIFLDTLKFTKLYSWKSNYWNVFRYASRVTVPLLGMVYLFLFSLEKIYYPNYVFSKLHINFSLLPTMLLMLILILIYPKIIGYIEDVIKMLYKTIYSKNSILWVILKIFLFAMQLLAPLALVLSLMGLSVDVFRYIGFVAKHLYVDPMTIFGFGVLLNYFIVIFDKPSNYWWRNSLMKHIQTQSVLVLLPTIAIYIVLLSLENFNYPNYIFSKFHLNLTPVYYIILIEVFICFLPKIASKLRTQLITVANDLSLRKEIIGVLNVVVLLICYIIVI